MGASLLVPLRTGTVLSGSWRCTGILFNLRLRWNEMSGIVIRHYLSARDPSYLVFTELDVHCTMTASVALRLQIREHFDKEL